MATTISNVFSINGVIDTSKDVMSNMTLIASAAGAWVTFDTHTGLWGVVVNEVGSSVASFTNSNIIGSITVTGTPINDLYNKIELEFPHKDLSGNLDIITYSIPSGSRFANEQDNILNLKYDLVNEPTQAEYLARLELKQNRVDKVIRFRTDYSMIGLRAGDLIDVTNSIYGFTNKVFRVLSISEEDAEDNNIYLSITAFEYDSSIYSSAGLVREVRTIENGIINACVNDTVEEKDDISTTQQIARLLGLSAANALLEMVFSKDPVTGVISQILKPKAGVNDSLLKALSTPSVIITADNNVCENATVLVTFTACTSGCTDFTGVTLPYTITGIGSNDINVPLEGTIALNSSGIGTLSITAISDGTIEGNETMTITSGTNTKTITIVDPKTYSITPGSSSIVEGTSTTLTVTTTGIPDGTSKPYTISGTGLGQLVGPTSGTVTISGGTASIPIQTKDIDATANTTLTVAFDSAEYYCSGSSATITITFTGTVTPPVVTTGCEFVSIPASWCGQWNASNVLVSVSPTSYITVLKAIGGQPSAAVPTACSVSGGSITITATENIDTSTDIGGVTAKIITSFNAPGSVKKITGTTITVIGY
jgi:hypothetical protein